MCIHVVYLYVHIHNHGTCEHKYVHTYILTYIHTQTVEKQKRTSRLRDRTGFTAAVEREVAEAMARETRAIFNIENEVYITSRYRTFVCVCIYIYIYIFI